MKKKQEGIVDETNKNEPTLEYSNKETITISLEEYQNLIKSAEEGKNLSQMFKDWKEFKKTPIYANFIEQLEHLHKYHKDAFFLSDIVIAVVTDHSEIVKFYIENEVFDVNYCSNTNYSLLHMAIGSRASFETIKILVDAKIEINKQKDTNTGGETALELVINKDFFLLDEDEEEESVFNTLDYNLIDYLIENEAKVDYINDKGSNILYKIENIEELKFLLNKGIIIKANDRGVTPLHEAYSLGKVKLLCEAMGDINIKDNKGNTPLHYRKSAEAVEFLIKHGYDVNQVGERAYTPLLKTVDFFKHEKKLDELEKILKTLIENGAKANFIDYRGQNPLHLIIDGINSNIMYRDFKMNSLYKDKAINILKSLIEAGADVNELDNRNQCPLHSIAAIKLNAKNSNDNEKAFLQTLFNLFIEKGFDINLQNNEGNTILHLTNELEIAKVLIEKDADCNIKNNKNKTPLHLTKNSAIATLLIEAGADINLQNNKGKTPLHFSKNPEIVKILVEAGASINVKDLKGNTPLDEILNKEDSNNDVIVELLKCGAEITPYASSQNLLIIKIASRADKIFYTGSWVYDYEGFALSFRKDQYDNLFISRFKYNFKKYGITEGYEQFKLKLLNSQIGKKNSLLFNKLIEKIDQWQKEYITAEANLFNIINCKSPDSWDIIKTEVLKEINTNHILKEAIVSLSKCVLPDIVHYTFSDLFNQVNLIDKFVYKIYHNHKNHLPYPSLQYEDLCIAELKYKLLQEGVPCKYSTFAENIKNQAGSYSPKLIAMVKGFQEEIINHEALLISIFNPNISHIPLIDLLIEHNTSKWQDFDKKTVCEFYSGLYPDCSTLLSKYMTDLELHADERKFSSLDLSDLIQKLKDNAGTYLASLTEEQIEHLNYLTEEENSQLNSLQFDNQAIIHHLKEIPLPVEFKKKFDEIFHFQEEEDMATESNLVSTIGENLNNADIVY